MKKQHTWDWSGTHTPVWTAVTCTGTALSTTVIAGAAHVGPAWALTAGTAGAAVTVASHLRGKLTTATRNVRAGLWLAFGGWSSHAIATDPWAVNNIAALAVGGIIAYGLTHATSHHDATQQAAAAEQVILAGRKATDDAWVQRFKRVCHIDDVRIVALEDWERGNGYTVEAQMPHGGTGVADIQRYCPALANDLRLAPGCGVEARPGADRSLVLVDVTTEDVFAQSVPFPNDYSPLTINAPFPIGLYRNGTPAEVYLREDSIMVIGQKRSGKTNQLHVLIAQLARMTDCLVWVIDFNAGALALPWITAWKEAHDRGEDDTVPNPAVDWVASTPEEAQRMTAAGLRIAKARKTAYHDRKRAKNVTLLPIDNDLPEIFIIIDECAEMLGADAVTKNLRGTPLREAAENYAEIQRIAGDSGVNVAICGLRSTQDVIAESGIKKGAKTKVHMRSDDASEYGFTFGDYQLDPADVPNKGNGFIRSDNGKKPRPFKGNEMFPRQMEEISIATAALQPPVDDISLKAAGEDYARRWDWDRYGHLFAGAPVAAEAAGGAATVVNPGPTANWSKDAAADWRTAAREREDRAEQRMRDLDGRLGNDPDEEARIRAAIHDLEAQFATTDTEDPRDPSTWKTPGIADGTSEDTGPARERMLNLLEQAGRDGMTAAALVDALAVSKKTVYQHLAHHQGEGTVGKLNTNPARYALKRFHQEG